MRQKSSKFKALSFKYLLIFILALTLASTCFAEYLGEFKAGTSIFYGANFHSDQGTIENPTSPEAQQRTPAGVWSDLTTPAIQNSKTGFYGGTIDTTGYAIGQYIIRLAGTVTTAKTTAMIFSFTIVANIESETYGLIGSGGVSLTALGDTRIANLDASVSSRSTYAGGAVASVTAPVTVGTNNDKTGYTASTVSDKTGYTVSTVQDKTGYSLTQTFPTHFADLAITETTGKVTVGTNSDKTGYGLDSAYDAAKTAASQSSVDTIDGIVDSILTESQSHPTLAEIEASTILMEVSDYTAPDNTNIGLIKTQTDKMNFTGTDIKATLDGEVVTTIEGSGDTAVDHNTGGADNLRYVYQTQGIDNATIKVYLKSDYDAGNRSDAYVKARSKTKTDGRWQWPVYLDSGFTYSIIFYKQGQYGPTKKDVTIP